MLNKENTNEHQLNIITKELKHRFKNLEKINNIEIKSEIELEVTNRTSYPAFMWQQKLVDMYHIFAMILGIIDARYKESNRLIEAFKENNSVSEIEKEITNNIIICTYRSNVIRDYLNFIPNNEREIIKSTLMHRPSYEKFNDLSKDIKKNKYQLSLQNEVMLAYRQGYENSLKLDIDSIMNIYYNMLENYEKKINQKKTTMYKRIEKKKKKQG